MASDFPMFIAHGEPRHPVVKEYPVDAATSFDAHELVFFGTGDDIEVCGADPANIFGIALAPSTAKNLYYNNITGEGNRLPVAILTPETIVGMASATTPSAANRTVSYGIVRVGTHWLVDTSDVVNTRVQVHDIDVTNGIFYVKFDPANLQGEPIVS